MAGPIGLPVIFTAIVSGSCQNSKVEAAQFCRRKVKSCSCNHWFAAANMYSAAANVYCAFANMYSTVTTMLNAELCIRQFCSDKIKSAAEKLTPVFKGLRKTRGKFAELAVAFTVLQLQMCTLRRQLCQRRNMKQFCSDKNKSTAHTKKASCFWRTPYNA